MIYLKKLPYGYNELEPYISAETVRVHYEGHHKGYVVNLNALIPGTIFENKSLEDIISESYGVDQKIFNNAAQIWNHDFYWQSFTPSECPIKNSDFLKAIERDFVSVPALIENMLEKGLNQFGSGWCWLVTDKLGKLTVQSTENADTPLVHGYIPLLVCDVWEHAYYLDYQYHRKDYLNSLLKNSLNFDWAMVQYAKALQTY